MNSEIKLLIASCIPVVASIVFYLLEDRTSFGKMDRKLRQVIIGIVFGGIAILGTEWGIPVEGAVVNCRDAAPLCAGLLFGGQAGILAGIIGGVERWIAVAWGVGSFTRLACSVSTLIAGIYAALLRKYMFRGKRPSWALAFASGIVMETFHLLMVFVTNMDEAEAAAQVVAACTKYMLFANGLAVLAAAIAVSLLSGESLSIAQKHPTIENSVQRWLFRCVFIAFVITTVFLFILQNSLAMQSIEKELEFSVLDVASDVRITSDDNILEKTREIADKAVEGYLKGYMITYDVDEINMVGKNGVIFDSTNSTFIGFDMHTGDQSAAFLSLLEGEQEYAQPMTNMSYDSRTPRKYAGVATDYGFIQVGYYSDHFNEMMNKEVVDVTKNRHIGETGVVFIVDGDDKIFSGPKDYINYNLKHTTLMNDISTHPEHTVFTSEIFGKKCLVNYGTVEGFRIIAYIEKAEALRDRDTSLYVNTFLEILVYAFLFALIDVLLRNLVINRIKRVNSSLARITSGDLDERVSVRENVEFAQLSDDINATVSTLKDYIGQAEKRIEDELIFAKNIQASALPNVFPAFPKRTDFDIFSSMDPAKEVGGDFYDFYITNLDGNETLNFLVADVSGKGIPAAMFMMKAKTMLKSLTESGLPLDEVFYRANNGLCEGNEDVGMFVTAIQGRLDLKSGTLTMVNAGHNPPLIKHADGSFEFIKLKPCLVLAGMEDVPYRTATVDFGKGDTIFLYTDGVSEATDSSNQLYGEDRLLSALNSVPYTSMQQLCAMVRKDIDDFVAGAPQFDDITMTAIKYNGTSERRELNFNQATLDDIPVVTDFIEKTLEDIGCPEEFKYKVDIIVDEIFSNICNYAYGGEAGVAAIIVEETQDPHGIRIIFADRGVPYNPLEKKDPDISVALEDREIGGLGIFMVKQCVDEMAYNYTNGRNILTVKKFF